MQRWFDRGNELANGVLQALSVDMPPIDVEGLRNVGGIGFGQPPAGNGAAPAAESTVTAPRVAKPQRRRGK
jgi:hypothetical protein